jgi:hypothetical protein
MTLVLNCSCRVACGTQSPSFLPVSAFDRSVLLLHARRGSSGSSLPPAPAAPAIEYRQPLRGWTEGRDVLRTGNAVPRDDQPSGAGRRRRETRTGSAARRPADPRRPPCPCTAGSWPRDGVGRRPVLAPVRKVTNRVAQTASKHGTSEHPRTAESSRSFMVSKRGGLSLIPPIGNTHGSEPAPRRTGPACCRFLE